VTIFRLVGAFCLATGLLASQADAHGGVSVEGNRCIMRIGPYMLNFTGYQPAQTYERFCDDIPDRGKTVIVLDAEQGSAGTGVVGAANSNELRDMLLDFRVLRNVGQAKDEDDLDKNTEIYLAPKKYPAGTITFQHDFEKGNYIGLVSATDGHGRVFVSRFPFAVGLDLNRSLWLWLVGGVALLAAGAGFFLYNRRRKAA
jgi:hypothetical protein